MNGLGHKFIHSKAVIGYDGGDMINDTKFNVGNVHKKTKQANLSQVVM